ncbi:neutral zinc metallopeptidase [Solirubrobacter soli]|uniref:neutral zinc metallopeptidase n=1 Tax=Solirubrobacter soli TaxID=363832 RepID=UPI0012FC2F29
MRTPCAHVTSCRVAAARTRLPDRQARRRPAGRVRTRASCARWRAAAPRDVGAESPRPDDARTLAFGLRSGFAAGYIVGHDVGHHVQHLLGTLQRVAACDTCT